MTNEFSLVVTNEFSLVVTNEFKFFEALLNENSQNPVPKFHHI